MKFTDETVQAIREIGNAIKSETSLDNLLLLLKEKSDVTGIHHNILLRIASDKTSLYDEVQLNTSKIDDEIEQLEERIASLKSEKHLLGSLICELHDHEFHWESIEKDQMCKYCGKMVWKSQIDVNPYLRKIKTREDGIYKKKGK